MTNKDSHLLKLSSDVSDKDDILNLAEEVSVEYDDAFKELVNR